MPTIGLLAMQFIPIILGIIILCYTNYKIIGIISILLGVSCIYYGTSLPCAGCMGLGSDEDPWKNEKYLKRVTEVRARTMILFVIGLGIALLVWNFVGN